jgi:hypothetical protein
MGSTHSGTSTPWWAMIEDSIEEFLTASSGDGDFGLPSPRRHGTGASLAPITTIPQMENSLVAQATMMVPSRTMVLWAKAASLLGDVTLFTEGIRRKLTLSSPPPSKRQQHGEASSPARKPLPQFNHTRRRNMSPHLRWSGS